MTISQRTDYRVTRPTGAPLGQPEANPQTTPVLEDQRTCLHSRAYTPNGALENALNTGCDDLVFSPVGVILLGKSFSPSTAAMVVTLIGGRAPPMKIKLRRFHGRDMDMDHDM